MLLHPKEFVAVKFQVELGWLFPERMQSQSFQSNTSLSAIVALELDTQVVRDVGLIFKIGS